MGFLHLGYNLSHPCLLKVRLDNPIQNFNFSLSFFGTSDYGMLLFLCSICSLKTHLTLKKHISMFALHIGNIQKANLKLGRCLKAYWKTCPPSVAF